MQIEPGSRSKKTRSKVQFSHRVSPSFELDSEMEKRKRKGGWEMSGILKLPTKELFNVCPWVVCMNLQLWGREPKSALRDKLDGCSFSFIESQCAFPWLNGLRILHNMQPDSEMHTEMDKHGGINGKGADKHMRAYKQCAPTPIPVFKCP